MTGFVNDFRLKCTPFERIVMKIGYKRNENKRRHKEFCLIINLKMD